MSQYWPLRTENQVISSSAKKTWTSNIISNKDTCQHNVKCVTIYSPELDCQFVCMFDYLHHCQPDYEQACLCAYVSIFACLRLGVCACVCGLKPVMASLRVILCNTVLVLIIISPWACSGVQSPTRGAFGSVGEVLEAAWPRCAPSFPHRRVPGTACTSGKPSLTMRLPAQPTPCLNRAGGCHVMPNTHMQEGLLAHTHI